MQVFHGCDVRIEKIDLAKSEFRSATDNITEAILETMVVDFNMTESAAIKIFYSSKSYEILSNNDTLLWQKPWQEIYNMLREELAI
jgi:hypothetical protein